MFDIFRHYTDIRVVSIYYYVLMYSRFFQTYTTIVERERNLSILILSTTNQKEHYYVNYIERI